MAVIANAWGGIRKLRFGGSDWSAGILLLIGLGGAAIIAFAVNLPFVEQGRAKAVIGGLLLAIACLLVGALLGFLFGIPRSLQEQAGTADAAAATGSSSTATPAAAPAAPAAVRPQIRYGANTNLEQISDWLTKILVGVGLTQLANVPGYLKDLGGYFGLLFGDPNVGPQIALALILAFTTGGFLFGYLWTRLFLATELTRADFTAMAERFERLEEAHEQQGQIDAKALSLTNQYFDPATGPSKVSIEELQSAIGKASPAVKVQIFYQAQRLRAETWAAHDKKHLMERTIPVFEALVASDTEEQFHRNFAQLGYALKDKRIPDYAAAEKYLSKAIQVRGPAREGGFEIYEFNRAYCRMKLDKNFEQDKPSTEDIRKPVIADLSEARRAFKDLHGDADIMKWLAINGLKLNDLKPA